MPKHTAAAEITTRLERHPDIQDFEFTIHDYRL